MAKEKLNWPDIVEKVSRKVAEDPSFKAGLTEEPRKTLQQLFSKQLPESFTDENIRNFAQKMFQITPLEADQLSDLDLEKVAGGKDSTGCSTTCFCA